MVHQLKVMKYVDRCGNLVLTLLNRLSDELNGKQNYTDRYMDLCTFSADSCFNVGNKSETMENIIRYHNRH